MVIGSDRLPSPSKLEPYTVTFMAMELGQSDEENSNS